MVSKLPHIASQLQSAESFNVVYEISDVHVLLKIILSGVAFELKYFIGVSCQSVDFGINGGSVI